MALIIVKYYREDADVSPLLTEWLEGLPGKAKQKCLAALNRLENEGHLLRRPAADYLRDGFTNSE